MVYSKVTDYFEMFQQTILKVLKLCMMFLLTNSIGKAHTSVSSLTPSTFTNLTQ